jgi:hypothetical protein
MGVRAHFSEKEVVDLTCAVLAINGPKKLPSQLLGYRRKKGTKKGTGKRGRELLTRA